MNDERIPKASEKIAARRTRRFAEKIRESRKSVNIRKAWWSNAALETLLLTILSLLNIYLVHDFFGKHAPDTTFSGPIIPIIAKTLEFFGVSLANGIQFVTLVLFLIFPITLYFFVRKISQRVLVAFFSAFIVIIPLYPFAEVRAQIAFLGVEGPHIASLTAIPLALYGLLSFIREGRIKNLIITAVSSALVALISPFGFLVYTIFASITAFSEMLLGRGRLKFVRLLVAIFFSATLVSFWYNPAFFFWMITGPMGEEIRLMIAKLIPLSFFILPALGAFGYLMFDRKPNLQPLFLASFFTITFGIIIIAGGGFFPSHPSRYAPEFGLSLAFLLSVIIARFTDYIRLREKKVFKFIDNRVLATSMIVILIVIFFFTIYKRRDVFNIQEESVLGMWTGVERGKIWIEKDKFYGPLALLGNVITGGGVISLTYLGFKERK